MVLWLVCGGSNIAIEVAISEQLTGPTKNLTILPMDERYGPPGHADSNYLQLHEAGFDPHDAQWTDVLERDLPLQETVAYYSELVQGAQAEADYTIGLFGLGADGHTAGVLPGSPATSEDYATVVGYEWKDFTRMTMTPRELVKTDTAFILAYGANKKEALERLQKGVEPLRDLPSVLHHQIPEVYVYNDQIESEGVDQ